MALPSRYLSQPKLLFDNFEYDLLSELRNKTTKATWDIIGLSNSGNGKFAKIAKDYPKLKVIYIKSDYDDDRRVKNAIKFFGDLNGQLKKYGFNPSGQADVEDVSAPWNGDSATRTQLNANLSKAFQNLGKPPLIIILLKNQDATIFADIKWWADCVEGVPSVCIRPNAVAANANAKQAGGNGRILANFW